MAVVNAPTGGPIGQMSQGSNIFDAVGKGSGTAQMVIDPMGLFSKTPAFYIPGQVNQYGTTTPQQQQALNAGLSWLQGNITPGAFQPSTGRLSPPMTALQNMSLEGIMNMTSGLMSGTGPEGKAINSGMQAMTDIFNSKPQDFENYYQNAVYGPGLTDFNRNILPAVDRKFASSFDGSQRMDAQNRVMGDFNSSMNTQRATLGFQSEQLMRQNILTALGLLPSVTGAKTGLLNQAMTAGDVPRQIEQQLTDREIAQYMGKIQAENTRVQQLLGGGTAQTQENIAFQPQVIPGKDSIFGGLISSL